MKSSYNYIVIEDVPMQQENLLEMLSGRMDLNLLETFDTAENAYQYLSERDRESIDLIFLDIELSGRNGLDFLNSIKNFPYKPRVIITTAYPQYAIPSFDYSQMVSHYVLKPIEAGKLEKAIDKAILEIQQATPLPSLSSVVVAAEKERAFEYFSVGDKEIKIFHDELIFCEGANVNVKLITTTQTHMTRGPLKNIEQKLPETIFARVHDSFIVNLKYVRGYTKRLDSMDIRHPNQIETETIRIGKKYRETFKNLMIG